TREVLRASVKQAFEEGWTPVDLEKRIEESGIFGEARAEMVAKTEMARAQVEGALWTAREVGVVAKRTELSGDHDQDDECNDAVDDGVIAIDDEFTPGGDPPFHPNCNCALVFYTAADPEAAEFVEEK
ncbi:MAG TPA: phage minor head protein, partial [Candidatus Limnocylindrales bacterium]|nr:phage minor head protein [Candidatus Limnocylindrales bacterium]